MLREHISHRTVHGKTRSLSLQIAESVAVGVAADRVMIYDVSDATVQAVLLALHLRREAAKREQLLQSEIEKVKRRMAKRRFFAISQLILLSSQQDEKRGPRRVVQRCLGKWRDSSIGGYVRDGDDRTYYENFRMERKTFDKLLTLIEKTRSGVKFQR